MNHITVELFKSKARLSLTLAYNGKFQAIQDIKDGKQLNVEWRDHEVLAEIYSNVATAFANGSLGTIKISIEVYERELKRANAALAEILNGEPDSSRTLEFAHELEHRRITLLKLDALKEAVAYL